MLFDLAKTLAGSYFVDQQSKQEGVIANYSCVTPQASIAEDKLLIIMQNPMN